MIASIFPLCDQRTQLTSRRLSTKPAICQQRKRALHPTTHSSNVSQTPRLTTQNALQPQQTAQRVVQPHRPAMLQDASTLSATSYSCTHIRRATRPHQPSLALANLPTDGIAHRDPIHDLRARATTGNRQHRLSAVRHGEIDASATLQASSSRRFLKCELPLQRDRGIRPMPTNRRRARLAAHEPRDPLRKRRRLHVTGRRPCPSTQANAKWISSRRYPMFFSSKCRGS